MPAAAARKTAKKKRTRNPAGTRLKLLQATVDLLAEKGPAGLSLKEVARRAKLSRGVAYQHFRDRDHMLRDAELWISSRLAERVRALDDAPMDQRISGGARVVLENREAAKLLVADSLSGKMLAHQHPLYKQTRKMLEGFVASGEARKDIDLEVLIYIMLGTNATMLMLAETHRKMSNDEIAERFAAEWSRILAGGIFRKPR